MVWFKNIQLNLIYRALYIVPDVNSISFSVFQNNLALKIHKWKNFWFSREKLKSILNEM